MRNGGVITIGTVAAIFAGHLTAQTPRSITVSAAHVIDGLGKTTANQIITVNGSKIERVGASNEPPPTTWDR
jgi:seryl-tRNA(Sec) selenium transferase